MTLDRFYPIFDSADWLERLVPLGIKLVQLRMKDVSPKVLHDHIRRARAICAAHDCTLVINDHWRMAIEEGCTYLHLGQEDLDDADMAAIKSAGLRLGVSTHDKAELGRALNLHPDYIALGPIYPTILKQMKWHQQGVEKLTTWRAAIGDIPLIAIGGMNIDRAAGAFAAGADVVAVVTDITLNESPETRVRAWLAATR
jgi:thiamine-phosphate pyrophosphorylase